jgi:hypothetical protein
VILFAENVLLLCFHIISLGLFPFASQFVTVFVIEFIYVLDALFFDRL